jgi:signal transduction histidine kinase
VGLNDAIREVVVLVQHQLARKGITFALDLSPELGTVWGDRVQLQQVLLNLLLNAIEALDRGAADRRELYVRSRGEGRDAVVVSVCDSGPGLAPGDRERVFDSLFTTKAGGMGVGLAISRSIIEAHSGRIWTEPNAGTGAVFHFLLPAGEPPSTTI